MSSIFGGSKEAKQPEAEQVAAEEKRRIRSGMTNSTILTSAAGLLDQPTLKRKNLLGE